MIIPEKVLLSTGYFPPITWFAYMIPGKAVHIEQMETFHKQTYRNRCEIMTASGKDSLVIPVTKPHGNHTLTRDIEICYREPWQQQHLKTIQAAYGSSPYFSYYADFIQPLFESCEILLIKQNHKILVTIFGLIGMEPSVSYTQEYLKKPVSILDLRSEISPKRRHIFTHFPEYPQVFSHLNGFMPDLSIMDLLFNLGPETRKYLEGIYGSLTTID